MTVRVLELDAGREAAWTSYVDGHPEGTFFHELRWRDVLLSTFKHDTRYLVALRDDRIAGVLPLVAIRSMFFGRSVVSVPFGVYGGILSNDAEVTQSLVTAGRELATEVGADYVELRQLHPAPGLDLPGPDLHVTFIREMPSSVEECMGLLPRKARAEVRKAKKNPEVSWDVASLDLHAFHHLFAVNKRSLGSPVFPKSLFLNLSRIYGESMSVLTIRRRGDPVAAVMNFEFRDTLMAYYSGALPEANGVSANNLMYEICMELAVERGLRYFDFGRSRKDTGSFSFKCNQGFEPRPLHYQFILKDGAPLPSINASNPRYNLAKKVFRALPSFLAEKVGSFVAKRMPV